ncbi:MAG: hypothetical protein MI747_07880, partial [Desulfobacterales bacterium]|nr:hypothetical protein [Desulfobacterales bacterium]
QMQKINTQFMAIYEAKGGLYQDEYAQLNAPRTEKWDELFDSGREALEDKACGYAWRISQGAGETMGSILDTIWLDYKYTTWDMRTRPDFKPQL